MIDDFFLFLHSLTDGLICWINLNDIDRESRVCRKLNIYACAEFLMRNNFTAIVHNT